MLNPFPTRGRPIPLAVKLSAAAVPEWSVLVGRTDQHAIYGLMDFALVEDGGAVFVGGLVQAPEFKKREPAVLKLDARGEAVWSRRLLLGSPGWVEAVAALPGGDLVLAGAVDRPEGPDGPTLGLFVAVVAPDGTPRWARKVSLKGHAMAPKRVEATGDGFVVLGSTGGGGAVDLVALSFSQSGTLAWARRYADPETKRADPQALAVATAGDLVFAGSTGEALARAGVVLVAGRDGELKSSGTLSGDRATRVTSVQPHGEGRLCVALTEEGPEKRSANILTATWTPPVEAKALRFEATPLEVRVSEFELRAEPLPYTHQPLPAGNLVERALPVPASLPASTAPARPHSASGSPSK
jgi:hypothetical protein